MAIANVALTNFTAGKFDAQLHGRVDIDQYQKGAKTLTNAIVRWFGGASKTPGTYYAGEVKNSLVYTRLIPFVFNTSNVYQLEFGNLYVRFYKNHVILGAPYEVTTTYLTAELSAIQYAQINDIIYLVSATHAPAQLVRSGDTSWALSNIDLRGPFLDTNTTTTSTITPSADTGTGITLTASASIFDSGHEGSVWRIKNGYVRINTVASATSVSDADVLDGGNLGTGPAASSDWAEAAFSDYRGWPTCIVFFGQRLVFASTDHQPNGVWLSEPEAYEQFTGGADDADSIGLTVSSRKQNRIQWLESSDAIYAGTTGGIIKIWSGSNNDPITPSNKNAQFILSEGSNSVVPVNIGGIPHYVQRDGKIIRTITYRYSDTLGDRHVAGDVTLLSREIIDSAIVDIDYQQAPHSIMWIITSSGKLISATIGIEQGIIAFTEQDDDGVYESVSVIPGDGYDEVWFVVYRTINGAVKRYVEYLKAFDYTAQEDQFFVRSGRTYDSTETSTITGLDHLEGEEVQVFGDGYNQPPQTVSGGQITLDQAASKVQVGLGYTTVIETLDLNQGSAYGSSIGKMKRISEVWVHLWNSIGGKVGIENQMDEIVYDLPSTLFTGKKKVIPQGGWSEETIVRIEQAEPLPLNVNGIFPSMETND